MKYFKVIYKLEQKYPLGKPIVNIHYYLVQADTAEEALIKGRPHIEEICKKSFLYNMTITGAEEHKVVKINYNYK